MTTTSYRDHVPLIHRGSAIAPMPRYNEGDVILGNAVRPTYVHGEPIVTLPFVRHDSAPVIDTPSFRPNWPMIVAGIGFALGIIVVLHLVFGMPGVGVLVGGRS